MPPSRRDVLRGLLGIPAGLVAACEDAPPRPVQGELLGPDHELAHRLREPFERAAYANALEKRAEVAVVGAGPAGLAAAWALRRRGVRDVLLLELDDVAGGTSRSSRSELTPYPWGAHYLPMPPDLPQHTLLRALLEEMGALRDDGPAEHIAIREPEERLFFRGYWYPGLYPYPGASEEDLAQLRRFEARIAAAARRVGADGRRAFALPFAACAMEEELLALDRLSAASWLHAQRFTSPRLRWLCDYACRDDYGLRLDETSAWALLFYFAARLPTPRPAEPVEETPLLAWPEGNGALVAHLARGAHIETRRLVRGLEQDERGVTLFVDTEGAPRRVRARHVVLAVPHFVARRLLARPAPEHAFSYGAWTVANLHLRERPTEAAAPLAWDNVLYESPSLGYVDATHQQGRDYGPSVWTWYFALTGAPPAEARERLLHARFEDWRDLVLSDLRRAHPDLEGRVTRLDVWRWGHAMAQPRVGFLCEGRRAALWAPEGRVHFAHSDLSGIALFEEAFFHGVRAADEIMHSRRLAGPG